MTISDKARTLDPELIVTAYRNGYFPMADPSTGVISWHSPDPRAIIPLKSFKVSRSLRQVVRKRIFEIRIDTSFAEVVQACAVRDETWISSAIVDAYTTLHTMGISHSIETWLDRKLVGGLYGLAIGGAFFGESMFSKESNASKVALVCLVELLTQSGFSLLDTQFMNNHVKQFGAIEISRARYVEELALALSRQPRFL